MGAGAYKGSSPFTVAFVTGRSTGLNLDYLLGIARFIQLPQCSFFQLRNKIAQYAYPFARSTIQVGDAIIVNLLVELISTHDALKFCNRLRSGHKMRVGAVWLACATRTLSVVMPIPFV